VVKGIPPRLNLARIDAHGVALYQAPAERVPAHTSAICRGSSERCRRHAYSKHRISERVSRMC
jgi:hypothetical protein